MSEITGTNERDFINGTAGNDILISLNGADTITARGGNDLIKGGGGADFIRGNAGDDFIRGGTGRDTLYGGRGDDVLYGGAGADKMSGDFGSDLLKGGSGNDLFYFEHGTAGFDEFGNLASDTIIDFHAGDVLHFGNYAAETKLIFQQDGANTLVYVDLGGDGAGDYLAVTVIDANAEMVSAASSFAGFDF